MRATRLTREGATQLVSLASWVFVYKWHDEIGVVCDACQGRRRLDEMPRYDAELALGQFAIWHLRCAAKAEQAKTVRMVAAADPNRLDRSHPDP